LIIDRIVRNRSPQPRIMPYVIIIILVATGFGFINMHGFIIFDYWGLNWLPLLNSNWFRRHCVRPTVTRFLKYHHFQLVFIGRWRNNLWLRLSFFAALLSKKISNQ
jgi:hypothetical protein